MLAFNHLLEIAELPRERVHLLRQQDTRMRDEVTLYRLWLYRRSEFRRYERVQAKKYFDIGDFVASFVVDPTGAAVFAGLSRVNGADLNAEPIDFDFLREHHRAGSVYNYNLTLDDRFAEYEGRLVIDWGPGLRSWRQRAHLQDKQILEIRREMSEVDWPGYMNVSITEQDVQGLAANWQDRLLDANGVYLLTCQETGAHYVGVALGTEGFLGRWRSYAADGHGGNKLLKERAQRTKAPLQISVLEVFGSTITENEAFLAESRWKNALGSRTHGLNAN